MRVAGRLTAEVLDYITPHVRSGITTGELDRLCHDYIVDVQGSIPAPLNYAPPGYRPYPKSICTSVNHQVCHGVPGDRQLKNGDIVNLDVTVISDGYHGDSSRMFQIGETSLRRGGCAKSPSNASGSASPRFAPARTSATSAMRSSSMRRNRATRWCASSVVTASAPGSTKSRRSFIMADRTPASAAGSRNGLYHRADDQCRQGGDPEDMADGWTIVTKDHSLSAQWEHTILVTETGYEVLTVSGGRGRPSPTGSGR
jgi:methionyl aminopeptidase